VVFPSLIKKGAENRPFYKKLTGICRIIKNQD